MVLLGVRPATPRFAWGTEQAPAAALVAAENLARSAQVGLLVLAPLVVGAAVLRARVPAFVPGALLLFALAWVAQAMAGHVVGGDLGPGVRDLRAGHRARHQSHGDDSGVAARGRAHRVLHQDRPRRAGRDDSLRRDRRRGHAGHPAGARRGDERVGLLVLAGEAAPRGRRAGHDDGERRVDLRRVGGDRHLRRHPGGSGASCPT